MQIGDCDTIASCQQLLNVANRRLEKVIADLDAAIAKGNADADVKAAYRMLVDLYKEGMAIKDVYIKDVLADNDFLRKKANGSKSKLRAFFGHVKDFVETVITAVAIGAALAK